MPIGCIVCALVFIIYGIFVNLVAFVMHAIQNKRASKYILLKESPGPGPEGLGPCGRSKVLCLTRVVQHLTKALSLTKVLSLNIAAALNIKSFCFVKCVHVLSSLVGTPVSWSVQCNSTMHDFYHCVQVPLCRL